MIVSNVDIYVDNILFFPYYYITSHMQYHSFVRPDVVNLS